MTKYLFLFSIGPVQSFIAQARKTQDLRAGSMLLSELIDFVSDIVKKNKFEIIFPNKDIESKPNRLLAEIEFDSEEKVTEFANNLKVKVKSRFKEIAMRQVPRDKFPENYFSQIDNFLEIYWAAKPLSDSYQKSYSDIERYFASIKNAKAFKQNPLSEKGRKCSLCGERNGLFYIDKKPYATQNDAIKFHDGNKGETLCAVCYTKRSYAKGFNSTAEICLLNCFDKILNQMEFGYKEKLKIIKNEDAQLLLADELTKENYDKFNLKDMGFDLATKLVKEFKRETKKQKIHLTKYYALLMFDGDKMGDWLSGVNLLGNQDLKTFHKEFSAKLGEFAKWAKSYVDINNLGKAVYAGGDDFLGFLNLETMLECITKLRSEFDIQVNQYLKQKFSLSGNITFSAGITIAHFKSPLHFVLQKTREMEKTAKEKGNRDAFAICVMKHSGEVLVSYLKWGENNKNIKLLASVIKLLRNKNISSSFMKQIQQEFIKSDLNVIGRPVFKNELKRLIKRSVSGKKEEKEILKKNLFELFSDLILISKKQQELFFLFNILVFLQRETSNSEVMNEN